MPVLNVAFVGSESLAKKIAKKGDVRDIESYVYKEERNGEIGIISLLRPLKHPEKIRPLLSVLNVLESGGWGSNCRLYSINAPHLCRAV